MMKRILNFMDELSEFVHKLERILGQLVLLIVATIGFVALVQSKLIEFLNESAPVTVLSVEVATSPPQKLKKTDPTGEADESVQLPAH